MGWIAPRRGGYQPGDAWQRSRRQSAPGPGRHRTGVSFGTLKHGLFLERFLPPGVPANEATMLQYFGKAT